MMRPYIPTLCLLSVMASYGMDAEREKYGLHASNIRENVDKRLGMSFFIRRGYRVKNL